MSAEAQGRPPEVFSARVAIILFLVGVFSFSAFITLSTFAPDFMDGDDGEAHALSKSAIGYAAMIKLARGEGRQVHVSRNEPGRLSTKLVVLTPETEVKLADLSRLAHIDALIVLPKWLPRASQTRRGWVRETSPFSEETIAAILKDIAPKARINQANGSSAPVLLTNPNPTRLNTNPGTMRPGKITSLQTIIAPEITPIVTTADGKTILGLADIEESPRIFVLSDPDFLNNLGFADIATARTGMALLDALSGTDDPITFDVTLNGFQRSRSLMRLAFEPPLLAATLSFVIVAAMLAWRAATRSGPVARGRRAIALGKRTLADSSAALIRLAGRDATMAPRYAQMVRTVVAEHIHVARDAGETTSAELDRIAQSRGVPATYSELAHEAESAKTSLETLNAARRLHAWTGDMIRATR